MRVGLIGHGGLLRAFSFARPIRGSGHVWGIYRQTCPDGQIIGFCCATWCSQQVASCFLCFMFYIMYLSVDKCTMLLRILISVGYNFSFNPYPDKLKKYSHLKLCLATAIHSFKWLKITDICLIWHQTFANLDVKTLISFSINLI